MSIKLNQVIFDSRLVTEDQVAAAALKRSRLRTIEAFKESEQEVPVRGIPSAFGNSLLEFSRPHSSGFQVVQAFTLEDHGGMPLLKSGNLALDLSAEIPGVPFIYVWYNGVSDGGGCEVYRDGKMIQSISAHRGGGKIWPVFKKYFGISKGVFNTLVDYQDESYHSSQYHYGSWTCIEIEHETGNQIMGSDAEYQGVLEFAKKPAITEEEWEEQVEKTGKSSLPYGWVKAIYPSYRAVETNTATRMVTLTEGNLFCKETQGCWFLDQPRDVSPREWFALRDKVRTDIEARKTEMFGPKPPSYCLTEEELATMPYEEQKKEAYRRKQICRHRHDDRGVGDGLFIMGIEVQAPFKVADYVRVPDKGIVRIGQISLRAHPDEETFVEEATGWMMQPGKEHACIGVFIQDLTNIEVIPAEEVPSEYRIEDYLVGL